MTQHIIGSKSLMAVLNGEPYSIAGDHPQFTVIRDAILNGAPESEIIILFDRAKAAEQFMHNEVEARDGILYYKGQPIHNLVADRILDFMAKGIPYQPLVEFVKRLANNPSKHSVDELYRFIEQNKLPLTEDGMVLGYKGITNDWKDKHTRTIDNSIGAVIPRIPRNQVDDNWRTLCSSGYHIGSLEYAKSFSERTVVVKFDPADAISVPEGDAWKLRTCFYEVVAECKGELPETVAISSDPYKRGNAVVNFLRRFFGIKPSRSRRVNN